MLFLLLTLNIFKTFLSAIVGFEEVNVSRGYKEVAVSKEVHFHLTVFHVFKVLV